MAESDVQAVIEACRALDDARTALRTMSGLNAAGTSLGPAERNASTAIESEGSLQLLSEKLRAAGLSRLVAKVPQPIEQTAGWVVVGGERAREKVRAGKMCIELGELRRELEALAPGALEAEVPHRWNDAEGWALISGSPYFLLFIVVWNVAFLGCVLWWVG